MKPHSWVFTSSSFWSVAVCKYGGGRPGRIGDCSDVNVSSWVDRARRVLGRMSKSPAKRQRLENFAIWHHYHSFRMLAAGQCETRIIAVRHRPLYINSLSTWHLYMTWSPRPFLSLDWLALMVRAVCRDYFFIIAPHASRKSGWEPSRLVMQRHEWYRLC